LLPIQRRFMRDARALPDRRTRTRTISPSTVIDLGGLSPSVFTSRMPAVA